MRALAKSMLRSLALLPAARSAREAFQSLQYRVNCIRFRRAAASLPIPPERLNFLVSGTRDVEWYARSGWLAAQSIRFALARNAVNLDELKAILDFGCGSGRVIRYWRSLPAAVHGTDYNSDLIRWCERHLPFASFQVNRLVPPLQYPDDFFDLIYALSVFTHLDEALQFAWMDELRRVAKPGGYLIITTHGNCPVYTKAMSADELTRFHSGELVVHSAGRIGSNQVNAYHPVAYVGSSLARGLTIVNYLEGGAFGNPYQDLWLLKK